MSEALPEPFELHPNPGADRARAYGPEQRAVLDLPGFATAEAEIASWPGYAPTPLHSLGALAARLGIERLLYKDEGGRFGQGSFKALGGAYAVGRLLQRLVRERSGEEPTLSALRAGAGRALAAGVTVVTATDGNHGRSVAWGARMFGCACRVYVHATVSEGRCRAIAALGATVVRIDGNYDESVRAAAKDAARAGWWVVSDTSYPGYMEIPRDVMHGYGVMAREAIRQMDGRPPSHVFVQGGVGGLAAAVCACLWLHFGEARPCLVVVEPQTAACLLASARAGRPTAVTGSLETVMAGLSCGEISLLAWPILSAGADAFMAIGDDAAIAAMRLLATGTPPLVAGESAVAGLAGLRAALARPEAAAALGLERTSRVLVFGTEGATDEQVYARLVGRSPEEVSAA